MDQLVALLLSLILSFTGISRVVDPVLVQDANRRVAEIQTNFSHDGMVYNEVLAWRTETGPDAIQNIMLQFWNSPPHRATLTDPSFTRIGCAVAQDAVRTYAACVLAKGSQDTTPTVQAPYKPSGDLPEALPDTAMASHG